MIDGIWIALIVIAALVGLYVLSTYNRLVTLRNRISESWSNVDTELKRRHDLVPNLVATVKGYATHEAAVFEEVTRIRVQVATAGRQDERARAESSLVRAVGGILAVAEAYPELKASAPFLRLQRDLVETEDRIQAARRFFNGNVRDFNNRVETFPSSLVARSFDFRTQSYFELESLVMRAVPTVDL